MIFRIFLKAVELLLRGATRAAYLRESDPTRILLDFRTQLQKDFDDSIARRAHSLQEPLPAVRQDLYVFIPFRDSWDLTHVCVESLLRQRFTNETRLHLRLIDNGSVEPETARGLSDLTKRALPQSTTLDVFRVDIPFNFSRINNAAVEKLSLTKSSRRSSSNPQPALWRSSDWFLFLNNDIEIRNTGALATLLEEAQALPQCGAVGCTLLYPNTTLQHIFLAPGIKLLGGHPLKGVRYKPSGAWFQQPRCVPAVTGAALLVRARDFESVGRFEDRLAACGQDLDLCLKLQKAGKANWAVPNVVMIHHETATRTRTHNPAEFAFLHKKWGSFLLWNDFYSRKLSRWSEQPALSMGEGAYPWERVTAPSQSL